MQFLKEFSDDIRGSALLMVFVAMAAIAALTVTFYNQMSSSPSRATTLNTRIQADQIISQGTALQSAFNIMVTDGVDPDDVEYTLPSSSPAFDTEPHIQKLYHPAGGGAPYHEDFYGWNDIIVHENARITEVGTAADDYMAVGLVEGQALCEEINQKLYGDTSIPEVSDSILNNLEGGVLAVLLDDATTCTSGCDQKTRGCIVNSSGNEFLYYHVLYAQ